MALNDFGLDHFHMTDFANRGSPYNDWTESKRRSNLSRLLNIIKAHVNVSVGVAFQKEAFEFLFSKRMKAICGGPYGLAAVVCMMDVGDRLREIEVDGSVEYVFESGAEGARQVSRVFLANLNDEEQRERYRLSSQKFENKRDFLPLQAADIFAYELYKQLPKTLKLTDVPPRYPLTFLADIPNRWGFLDGSGLSKFAAVLSMRADLEDSVDLGKL